MISFKKISALLGTIALVAAGALFVPPIEQAFAVGGLNGPGLVSVFQQFPGGINSSLNITAAAVVKATPGEVMRISVIAAGSSGSLTLNDAATTGGATTANEIFTVAQSALTVGEVITLEFPCKNGIVVSAVPVGSPQLAISYN